MNSVATTMLMNLRCPSLKGILFMALHVDRVHAISRRPAVVPRTDTETLNTYTAEKLAFTCLFG
jgi:hypothetical protein